MKILLSPDSFKGTLTAREVCEIGGRVCEKYGFEHIELPLSDGGEGLCACLSSILQGEFIKCRVTGPFFGEMTEAAYYMTDGGTAIIEMAQCAGLPLALGRENPLTATTYGVGEIMLNAKERGAKSILLGLGGSATNDCGTGMAQALGYKFYDENGNELCGTGAALSKIKSIVKPCEPFSLPVRAACDVTNPLYGESGAAFVFAGQKGADRQCIEELDRGLCSFALVMKNYLHCDVAALPGAGAAGGLGAGVVAFLKGELRSGIDIVLDESKFDEKLGLCDAVITGEGRLDSQSVNGKVISGVCKRAVRQNKMIITVCGCSGEGYERAREIGVEKMYFSSKEKRPFDEIKKSCKSDLERAFEEAVKELSAAKGRKAE